MTDRAKEMADAIARAEELDTGDGDYVRIRPPGDPAQVYSVRIPANRLEQLRRIAAQHGTKPSTLIREWVVEKLDETERPRRDHVEVGTVAVSIDELHVLLQPGGRLKRQLAYLDAVFVGALDENSRTMRRGV